MHKPIVFLLIHIYTASHIIVLLITMMIKILDAESAVRQENEVYVKDSPTATEPPEKKVKHGNAVFMFLQSFGQSTLYSLMLY